MTEAPRTVSGRLPQIWVERGGTVLALLLAAVDEHWAAQWGLRPALDRPRALSLLAAATGRGPLLAEVGGVEGVRRPGLLPHLLLATLRGRHTRLGDWLDCLFGLKLQAYDTTPLTGRRPSAVRLTLAGPPGDRAAVTRVLRRLVPAHLTVDSSSIVWIPHEEGGHHD